MKIKYKLKAKGNEDKELCSITRTTYLDWGNEYDQWYIIPTVYIFNGFGITFCWLKIQYSEYYDVITYEEEDNRAKAHYDLTRNKNESSSI